jgi:hypothetical protein
MATRGTGVSTVTVTGHSVAVVPFFHPLIHATSVAPNERYLSPLER